MPKNFSTQKEYEKGFSVDNLFANNACGIVTSKDKVNICSSKEEAEQLKNDALELPEEIFRRKYNIQEDSRDWSVSRAINDVKENKESLIIVPYAYRPFDTKFIVYTGKTNGIVAWPRYHSFHHLLHPQNLSMLICRQQSSFDFQHVFVTSFLSDKCTVSSQTKEASYVFPLYQTTGEAGSFFENQEEGSLVPNFNPEIIKQIEKGLGEPIEPLELFDYIYAILHSPTYRERYKEFLKIDFPRIPYPTDKNRYHQLSVLGSKLRKLHLLENSSSWKVKITYPQSGTNKVESLRYHAGNVYINEEQYFGNVTEEAWDFYIGGYQPAQKWLKDRKEKTLSFSDIRHYQEIITALCETQQLMKEIDVMVLPDIGKSN